MPDKDKAIELELRQIIQADRAAVDILRHAEETRRSVVAKTEKEKADILADAERQRAKITEQAKKDLEAEIERRLAAQDKSFSGQLSQLEALMDAYRAEWVETITRAILDGTPAPANAE